jgi:hypothetical protein
MEQVMSRIEQLGALVRASFATPSEFRPCAFFDVRLDCIRVIARDCSVLETRINEHLTVLEDNYYQETESKQYVGFTVKGARHFCAEHGLSLSTPITMSALLDAILKAFPDLAVEFFVNGIARPLVKDEGIKEVDISPLPDEPALSPA